MTHFLVTSNGVDAAHLRVPSEDKPSFLALNKEDGSVLWSSNRPGNAQKYRTAGSNPTYAQPVGKPQVIFPGVMVYSFNNRELLWKFDCNPKDAIYRLGGRGTANDAVGTPVIYKDKLFIAVGQDPEHDTGVGHLYCIDITKIQNGQIKMFRRHWRHTNQSSTNNSTLTQIKSGTTVGPLQRTSLAPLTSRTTSVGRCLPAQSWMTFCI